MYTYRLFFRFEFKDDNANIFRSRKRLRRIFQSNYSVSVNSTETSAVLSSDFIELYQPTTPHIRYIPLLLLIL